MLFKTAHTAVQFSRQVSTEPNTANVMKVGLRIDHRTAVLDGICVSQAYLIT